MVALAQLVALPLWGSFPRARARVWVPAGQESVPHIRISPPALGSAWGEVFYPGAAAIPSPARLERARARGLLHSCTSLDSRSILNQKNQEIFTNWMVLCWSDCSGLCHINCIIQLLTIEGCGDEKLNSEAMGMVKNTL